MLFAGKALYVAVDDTRCQHTFTKIYIDVKEVSELTCYYNKADTRMIWHIANTASNPEEKNVTVRANDIDILV